MKQCVRLTAELQTDKQKFENSIKNLSREIALKKEKYFYSTVGSIYIMKKAGCMFI